MPPKSFDSQPAGGAGGEGILDFPMAEKPIAGETKVVKDVLPAPSSKLGGNPVFRMMGEFVQPLAVMLERKKPVLVTD